MSYARNLLSRGEEIVFESRQHWFAVLGETWPFVIASILAFAVLIWQTTSTAGQLTGLLQVISLLVLVVSLGRIGLKIWSWRNQEWFVTTRRLIKAEGIFNKEMGDSSLEKVNDAHLTQNVFGRIFGFGDLDILTAADEMGGIEDFPLLAVACATIGGIQIQLRGTLGGNLANASPAGDTFPPLAVYEPVVHVVSAEGARTIPISELFTGVKRTSLRRSELIESIEVPFLPKRPRRQRFWKVGTRAASAISKTVAAGLLWMNGDGTIRELRFALGSMAPTVRRLRQVEAFVTGKKPTAKVLAEACALLEKDVAPIDDVRSTADYRLEVSKNLLRSFLDPNYRG